MNENDDEVGFDLTAWEAPPPPTGIADAVVARVAKPIAAGAVEAPTRRSRWWIAGGLAAALIGVASIALVARGDDEVEISGSGAVATAKPSHLELGGTAVDLEANTDVGWVRDGKRMIAMQPRGAATWKVAADNELVIDAGATVASVKASGASLRVEVEMNLSDARLIGTSVVTAAAVALVTVIVYEGHVKVTGGDKTVEVAAGSTVQIAPNKPPVEPDRVSGLEKRLEAKIKFLELENQLLRKQMEGTVPRPDSRLVDFRAFHAVMATLVPAMRRCGDGTKINDHFDLKIELAAGKPPSVGWDVEDLPEKFASCVDAVITKAKFPDLIGTFDYTLAVENKVAVAKAPVIVSDSPVLPVKPPTPVDSAPSAPCGDTAAISDLEAKGDAALSAGQYARGLVLYEKVLKCKPSIVHKTYLAACRAHVFPRAKVLYQVVRRTRGDNYAQICLKEGFDPR